MDRRFLPRAVVLGALGVLVLASCRDASPDAPQIEIGVSTCHACQRVLDDIRWVAADRSTDGSRRVFDDPGCLFVLRREAGGQNRSAVFHDRGGADAWIHEAETWFAAANREMSPAGFGWAAYASFADAQDAVTAAGGGRILRYEQAAEIIGTDRRSDPAAAR